MTYGAFTQEFAPYASSRRARRLDPKIGVCIIALGATTTLGLWALFHPTAPGLSASAPQVAAVEPPPAVAAPPRAIPALRRSAGVVARPPETAKETFAKLAMLPQPSTQPKTGLLDPELTSSYAAVVFARKAPLHVSFAPQAQPAPPSSDPAEFDVAVAPEQIVPEVEPLPPLVKEETTPTIAPRVADVPLPLPRPANIGIAGPARTAQTRVAYGDRGVGRQGAMTAPSAAASTAQPSFFDKLFGRPKEPGQVLAYAAPEDGMIGNVLSNTVGRPQAPDRYTAVYNITTHTVTLPDGTRLEAHSGLGAAKDNPRMVTLRMVGATPPNLYELSVREAPFHGVRALRLTPTGGTTFGRAGLLAHTYMLRGRSGESNGCVVFRDYQAFLRAYDSGAIRRLAVVAGA